MLPSGDRSGTQGVTFGGHRRRSGVIVASGERRGSGRFILERRLGAGGFGVVYAARDTRRDTIVALKTLVNVTPESLIRFKREFRALTGITHPNLVSLYELISDADQWFFTMELVDGRNLLEHVWGRPIAELAPESPQHSPGSAVTFAGPVSGGVEPLDVGKAVDSTPAKLDRVLSVFIQLVEGVAALHRAGAIHRDLKPSNVLVTDAGRVVVLDFGLLREVDSTQGQQTMEIAGTPRYMSPEQAAGLSLSTASDWYSVGVMLFEALTGRLPAGAMRPSEVARGIPEHLDPLVAALLTHDSRLRPTADAIVSRLRANDPSVVFELAPAAKSPAAFVGRQQQLRALHEAAESAGCGTVIACVSGASGIGKSTLVRRFLEEWRLRHLDALIVSSRCYERESVPYKALDSLVDSLARYLNRLGVQTMDSMLPRDIGALAQVFPVLQQAEDRLVGRRRIPIVPDAQELRRRAFAAMRELMTRLADRRQVVVVIDDLQWGDVDSADLIREICRNPDGPPMFLIASYRSDEVTTSPCLQALLRDDDHSRLDLRHVTVDPLTAEESRQLVASLAETGQVVIDAEAVVAEAGGSPFFIDELVRAGGETTPRSRATIDVETDDARTRESSLAEMIRRRVSRLSPEAREVLELVSVNGQPLPDEVLRVAAGGVALESAVTLLTAQRLLRTRDTAGNLALETYHDRIREAVVGTLSESAATARSRALAKAFAVARPADVDALADHFLAAGETDRAVHYALLAGRDAERALAFERAAATYRRALDLLAPQAPERDDVALRLGEALVNAGRGTEAARIFLGIRTLDARQQLPMRERAAQQLIYSGHFDEGLDVIKDVLASIGLQFPESTGAALRQWLTLRLRLRLRGRRFRERQAADLPPTVLARIDTCWGMAIGLGAIDPLRGAVFQTQGLLWALAAGEPQRIARALALEAAYSSTAGSKGRQRTRLLLDEAAALAHHVATPYNRAFLALATGIVGQLEGTWTRAVEASTEAEQIFRDSCTGVTWEIDTAWFFGLGTEYFRGNFAALTARHAALTTDAIDRGDRYALSILGGILAHYVHLIADRPDLAVFDVRRALDAWSRRGFHLQHIWEFWSLIQVALYQSDGHAAWARITDTWRRVRASTSYRVQFIRINMLDLRGRAALAAAAGVSGRERQQLLDDAAATARRLQRERSGFASLFARFLLAGILALQRRDGEVAKRLIQIEELAQRCEMPVHGRVARRRRGEHLGGNNGRALVDDGDAWLSDRGVKNPAHFARMIAPWTVVSSR